MTLKDYTGRTQSKSGKKKKKSPFTTLPSLKMVQPIPCYVPLSVFQKIWGITQMIDDVEWSGVQFYTSEGVIGTDGFSVRLEDLFLMDIGSATHTEFDLTDPELFKYREGNPETFHHKIGMIHSHNKMDVKPSNTDMEELNHSAQVHEFYLSVIVNNEMDFNGFIAVYSTVEKDNTLTLRGHLNTKGEVIKYSTSEDSILIYPLTFHLEDFEEMDENTLGRIMQIEQINNQKKQAKSKNNQFFNNYPYNNDFLAGVQTEELEDYYAEAPQIEKDICKILGTDFAFLGTALSSLNFKIPSVQVIQTTTSIIAQQFRMNSYEILTDIILWLKSNKGRWSGHTKKVNALLDNFEKALI